MAQKKWFDAWCAADKAAAHAIRNAARESLLTLQRGEVPSDAETREIKRRRDQAQAVFQQTMAAMRAPRVRNGLSASRRGAAP